jgi:hypothetical protein
MCTVTVYRGPERLLVTMNRDERRTRADELPPKVAGAGGAAAWIGPTDSEKGGTWFGANDRGVVACLLNAYAPEDLALLGRDDIPSRGRIIPRLLAREPHDLRPWLAEGLDPTPYPSFTLVVATAHWGQAYCWRLGSGVSTSDIDPGWTMITSSLWRTDDVLAWRQRAFDSWRAAGAAEVAGVPAFNLLEQPDRRPWSPMMTRPISITRSVTQAELQPGRCWLEIRYWRRDGELPVAPSRPTASERLPLVPPAAAR